MGFLENVFGGGGGSKPIQRAESSPLYEPRQILDIYKRYMEGLGGEPTTPIPETQELAPLERLSGGDFDRLETSLAEAPLRRLGRDRDIASTKLRANLRRIGLADDPAALALEKENVMTPFLDAESDILSGAAAQRYGLQGQDIQAYNQNVLNRGIFGAEQARQRYELPRQFFLQRMLPLYGLTGTQKQQGSGVLTAGTTPGIMQRLTEGANATANIFKGIGSFYGGGS